MSVMEKTYQNNGKFFLQLGGVRHGHLQRHDVMLHLRLAVHTLYVPHVPPLILWVSVKTSETFLNSGADESKCVCFCSFKVFPLFRQRVNPK